MYLQGLQFRLNFLVKLPMGNFISTKNYSKFDFVLTPNYPFFSDLSLYNTRQFRP